MKTIKNIFFIFIIFFFTSFIILESIGLIKDIKIKWNEINVEYVKKGLNSKSNNYKKMNDEQLIDETIKILERIKIKNKELEILNIQYEAIKDELSKREEIKKLLQENNNENHK